MFRTGTIGFFGVDAVLAEPVVRHHADSVAHGVSLYARTELRDDARAFIADEGRAAPASPG